MPATKDFCEKQINRLECLKGFQWAGQVALTELFTMLRRSAQSNEEAETAITMLITDHERAADPGRRGMPEPGEIALYVAAARRSAQAEAPSAPARLLCGHCEEGWVRTVIETQFCGVPQTYEGVIRCACNGGTTQPKRMEQETSCR